MVNVLVNNQILDLNEGNSIVLERIVEDLQNPDFRYATFSYTIKVPKTKNNSKIFRHIDENLVEPKFNTFTLDASIVFNSVIILKGSLIIKSITDEFFQINIFDESKKIFDSLKDRNLNEILIQDLYFESSLMCYIVSHNNRNLTSDQTFYQFPFIFYQPCQTSDAIGSGNFLIRNILKEQNLSDGSFNTNGANLFTEKEIDYTSTHYNNWISSTENKLGGNREINTNVTYRQFPPAFYVIRLLEQVFEDLGVSVRSNIFKDSTKINEIFKRLIIPHTGSGYIGESNEYLDGHEDIWDSAIVKISDGDVLGGISPKFRLILSKFLPDMSQYEFLEQLIKLFNLYMYFDSNNSILYLDTYSDFFQSQATAYHLSNNKISKDFEITSLKESEKDIVVKYSLNEEDGEYSSASYRRAISTIQGVDKDNMKEVELDFEYTHFKSLNIINSSSDGSGNVIYTHYLPAISKTNKDNDEGILWFEKHELEEGEDETRYRKDELNYHEGFRMLYYHGIVKESLRDKAYITNDECLIFIDPNFEENVYYLNVMSFLDLGLGNYPPEFQPHRFLYESLEPDEVANLANLTINDLRDDYIGNNPILNKAGLYELFYKDKFLANINSNYLKVKVNLSSKDFKDMLPNRLVFFNDVYYTLLRINKYDIVKNTCDLLLKRHVVKNTLNSTISDTTIVDNRLYCKLIKREVDARPLFYTFDMTVEFNKPIEVDINVDVSYYNPSDDSTEIIQYVFLTGEISQTKSTPNILYCCRDECDNLFDIFNIVESSQFIIEPDTSIILNPRIPFVGNC